MSDLPFRNPILFPEDPLSEALARIAELERWKTEGLSVIDDWERLVYSKVNCRTDQLGLTHAAVVADRIEELEGELRKANTLLNELPVLGTEEIQKWHERRKAYLSKKADYVPE